MRNLGGLCPASCREAAVATEHYSIGIQIDLGRGFNVVCFEVRDAVCVLYYLCGVTELTNIWARIKFEWFRKHKCMAKGVTLVRLEIYIGVS